MGKRGKLTIVAAVWALITGLSASAPAKIIYVDDDAKESGKGASWADPYKYLQTAVTAAGAGDEIRVAQGLYRPDQGLPAAWRRDLGPPAPRPRRSFH